MIARAPFDALADVLLAETRGDEVLLLGYYAEDSDFARFNHARLRQAGHVAQRELRLELIDGARLEFADHDVSGRALDERDDAVLGRADDGVDLPVADFLTRLDN